MYIKKITLAILLIIGFTAKGQNLKPLLLELKNRGFFHDREYFAVRSDQLVYFIQADRADLGSAVTGYLFNADSIQLTSKDNAFNYVDSTGVSHNALEVIMDKSKFAFTAFGEHTRVNWGKDDGIPAVEAKWWADGVQVTEKFSGFSENNTIRRTILLEGKNLHGEEKLLLELRLPGQHGASDKRALWVNHNGCLQGIAIAGDFPVKTDEVNNTIEIGPLTISPEKTIKVETFMFAQLPASTKTPDNVKAQISQIENENQRDELLQATKAFWNKGSGITTEDEVVQEVFDNARFSIPAIVSNSGSVRTGPFQYQAQWVRDNSQFSLGLTASGYFEEARAVLEHCLRDMITTDGTTMIGGNFEDPDMEQFDQTGEIMYALRWYTDLSGDTTLVTTYRNKLLALIERPLNPKFHDETGLVHNHREFWEQTMNDAYELAYNTYVVVGLREAVAMAGLLNAEENVQRWSEEADKMQKAILNLLVDNGTFIKRRNVTGEVAKHLVNAGGHPDVPSMNVEHNSITPDATMSLPIIFGLVDPDSPIAANTLNEVEKLRNMRWSGGGYDRYDSSSEINMPGPWGIAGALTIRGQHTAGMFDRSRSTLEWFRNVTGGNAGLYYEEIPLLPGSQQSWLGLVVWPSGELPAFVVQHYLGLKFENSFVIVKPKLYPGSPAVKANLRFRNDRLKLEIPGTGPYDYADVNGKRIELTKDGALYLPYDFAGGTVKFHKR